MTTGPVVLTALLPQQQLPPRLPPPQLPPLWLLLLTTLRRPLQLLMWFPWPWLRLLMQALRPILLPLLLALLQLPPLLLPTPPWLLLQLPSPLPLPPSSEPGWQASSAAHRTRGCRPPAGAVECIRCMAAGMGGRWVGLWGRRCRMHGVHGARCPAMPATLA